MTSETRIRAFKILRRVGVSLLGLVLVLMVLPDRARSQLGLDPCCAIISVGLNSISKLLSGVVAKPLASIQQTEQQDTDFEQNIVFPVASLKEAQALAMRSQNQFAQMRQIFQLQVSSATLPGPKQLEQVLLSRNPGNISQITQHFSGLYGAVMPATDAPPALRDAVDMFASKSRTY